MKVRRAMWTTKDEAFTVLKCGAERHSLQSFLKAVRLLSLHKGTLSFFSFTVGETEAPRVTLTAQTTQ